MKSPARIGFAGLGEMGALIAQRLLAAGHELHIYNRTNEKVRPFVAQGATQCDSPADLARHSDVLLLCLFDEKAIESVLFGDVGVAQSAHPGLLVVDLSTTHPKFASHMSLRLNKEFGVGWVDAPVSGGPPGAAQGTLAVMAGGEEQDIERIRSIFSAFSSQVTHVGPAGCGQLAKACNQLVNFGNALAVAEAMNLAARSGLDPLVLPRAMSGAFSDSSLLRYLGPRMAEGKLQGNSLMTMKDLQIVLDVARSSNSSVPLSSLMHALFQSLLEQGYVSDGIGGVSKFYSKVPFAEIAESLRGV
jgi:3-hydroxyisobutyrate dehydrogenase